MKTVKIYKQKGLVIVMRKKERALLALEILENTYPDAECSLDYKKPHELLIATRLAAQCTDVRVNMVTPELFGTYPSIEALSKSSLNDIEKIVKSKSRRKWLVFLFIFRKVRLSLCFRCHSGRLWDSVSRMYVQ